VRAITRIIATVHIILSLPRREQKAQNLAHMKTTTPPLKHSVNRTSCPRALLLIPIAVACFALSLQARATCQEGCLTNGNTVLGEEALVDSSPGLNNTAIGINALHDDTGGIFLGGENTATGAGALENNTTGHGNTATGASALEFNTTGSTNIAVGSDALFNNMTGNSNIAVGIGAGQNLTTGSNNIYIGNDIGAGINSIDESNRIRIGNVSTPTAATFIAGISGASVNGSQVVIGAGGRLGVTASSVRFKDEIKSMGKTSEAILALKPVTFRYKHEVDPDGIRQFGLVAEDVEKVNPDLVVRDKEGKPYSVRYDQVNAMLLNEFLKARRQIDAQQKQIDALTAGLQKVSAQLEASKPAPQTVKNTD
jgi:hypothetical protein